MKNNIQDLVKEALLINTRIKKDKVRLAELKDKILEDSTGKNASYKIETETGIARVTKYKDKLTYSFDESHFKSLDEETKNKLISDKIVDQEVSYYLNNEKYEIIKKYPDNNVIKSLVKENFKNSHFKVSFYPKKQTQNDIEFEENNSPKKNEKTAFFSNLKNFFKR
tara:strand:- start:797 stop:1297 length:501 start_codon:yes stop_codon:yes gene_type:complete